MSQVIRVLEYLDEIQQYATYRNIEFNALDEFVSTLGYCKKQNNKEEYLDCGLDIVSKKLENIVHKKVVSNVEYNREVERLEYIAKLFEGD